MKFLKSSILILVCLSLVLSFCGCERKQGGYYQEVGGNSEIVDSSDNTEDVLTNENTEDGKTESNKENNKNNSNTSNTGSKEDNKNTVSGTGNKRSEADVWKIRRDVKPSAEKSLIKNLDYKGKKLRMLVWSGDLTERDEDILAAFEKKYNCDIEVTQGNYESYFNVISTQLASGKPFDIIKLHRAHFPHAAITKMIQPLENYVAEEDLTTTAAKPGIDWEWTMANASWNDHVYYTISGRPCALNVFVYNKLLFKKFGLEDPMDLWKKGKWNLKTIESYAKQVSAADKNMYFYSSPVAKALSIHATGDVGYYNVSANGKVNWLGANTDFYNYYVERMRLLKLSPLDEQEARLDSIASGKCMMHCTALSRVVSQVKTFKDSAAFGKNVNNIGVVPVPYYDDGSYTTTGVHGYASSRGCDPTAAIALTVFYASQGEGWDSATVPAIKENRDIFYGLYDKMPVTENYTFLTADGLEEGDILYQMNADIAAGGDIMKLLQDYAPKVKNMMQYSLSKQ